MIYEHHIPGMTLNILFFRAGIETNSGPKSKASVKCHGCNNWIQVTCTSDSSRTPILRPFLATCCKPAQSPPKMPTTSPTTAMGSGNTTYQPIPVISTPISPTQQSLINPARSTQQSRTSQTTSNSMAHKMLRQLV